MKIIGIEELSDQEIRRELEMGGRFVSFSYCISLVLVSFQRSSNIYFLRADQSGLVKGLPFTLITLVLGWWDLPWGPLYSLHSLLINFSGGKDVTEHITEVKTVTPAGVPSPDGTA